MFGTHRTAKEIARRAARRAIGSGVVGLGVAGVLLAGCGNEPETSPPPPGLIPRVDHPRDVAAVAGRPCDLLSAPQAAAFGLDRPPRPLPGASGRVDCEWRSSRADVWVYLSTLTDKPTLETVYANRKSLASFELTEVAGYPAIASRTDPTLPVCDIDIKTAERQSVTVTYDSTRFTNTPQQGCVVGKQVARAVVLNLPLKN